MGMPGCDPSPCPRAGVGLPNHALQPGSGAQEHPGLPGHQTPHPAGCPGGDPSCCGAPPHRRVTGGRCHHPDTAAGETPTPSPSPSLLLLSFSFCFPFSFSSFSSSSSSSSFSPPFYLSLSSSSSFSLLLLFSLPSSSPLILLSLPPLPPPFSPRPMQDTLPWPCPHQAAPPAPSLCFSLLHQPDG